MRKISEQENMEQDQKARERILHDLTTTFIVEAGAGSGKTTSLVGRMINLIRFGHANIHQIAAITFTKKAASELQGRFRIKLEQEIRKTQLDEERILLQEAVRNMNQK